MPDLNRPRRGSMAVRPRKRADTQNVRVHWQSSAERRILGFAGYKAGMTHVSYIDDSESPTKGQEIVTAATVVEVPPLYVYGMRMYNGTAVGDVFCSDQKMLEKIGIKKQKTVANVDETKLRDVRLLAFTQPYKTGIGKKCSERMELGLGGKDAKEKLELAKTFLGKELKAGDVFKTGELIDVLAVTKGKGWQGAVKRFGVAVQRRKATGKYRHVGTLGQWHPNYVLYTAPMAGQTGYHTRTELNKRLVRLGSKPEEINPSGGFEHYGFVKNDYVLVKGSIAGPVKRLVKIRAAVRAKGKPKELTASLIR